MKKAGFTLIEVIIVLALIVLILMLVGNIFTTGNRIFSDSDAKSTLQLQAQAIEEEISKAGMEAVGIASIQDEFGNQITGSGDQITEVPYGELNLTDINGEDSENKWLGISEMTIYCYKEDGNNISVSTTAAAIIIYDKDKKKLSTIDGKEFQGEVESVRINPVDVENPEGTFKNTNSIVISIMLYKKSGFIERRYPISITVKFRNNFMR